MAPNDPKSTPDPSDDKMSGIISELRDFLSGVQQENKPLQPSVDSASACEIPILERPLFHEAVPPRVDPPPAVFSPPVEPVGAANNNLPSDSDFWNGNVLGWPSEPTESSEELSEESMAPFFSNIPPDSDPQPAPPEAESLTPLIPPAPIKPETGAPQAPQSSYALFEAEAPSSNDTPVNEAAFSAMLNPSANPPAPPPPPEPVPAPILESSVVPVEFESAQMRVAQQGQPNGHSHEDELEAATEVKPDNLFHVACIVPSGQGAKGQQFFSALRVAGQKSANKLQIEAVFIHDWSPDLIDVDAWEKSALLSGADLMFIIAPKAELSKFSGVVHGRSNEAMPKRLIALEHIGLQNLYADLLCHFKGKARAKS